MFPQRSKSLVVPLFVLLLVLAACQRVPDAAAGSGQAGSEVAQVEPAGATLTPFLPASPTTRPTLTQTPTVTATPTVTSTATPEPCTETRGVVEPMEITFHEGEDPYVFRVYTPPCFEPEGETRYPVLYMIHGQTYKDDQWDRLGLDEAADEMIVEGKAAPFLIVMPLEKNTFGDIYESPFGKGLVDDLVPWVDRHYPTCAERDCRAIGGLSRGGAWALRLGFTRWDLFGSVGLHSTPPFIGDPNQFPYWLREIPADQVPRIYMDTGNNDWWIRPTREFEALLVYYKVVHEWILFDGAHDEAYWSAHVFDYLTWYTAPWKDLP